MKRNSTIDILRGIAILAVVLDHAWYLYPQFSITQLWHHTYFSIPWFIFLSGMTNSLSLEKHQFSLKIRSYLLFLLKRVTILIPYVLTCLAIFFLQHYPDLNWNQWIHDVLYFSIQPTYYYVNLILQLYLIVPVLYTAVKHTWNTRFMPVLITIILILTGISVWIGVPPWPFSPAARLFGGIYLSVFFLGMLFSKPTVQKNGKLFMASVIIFLISEGILLGTNAGLPGFAQTFLFNLWAISLIVVMFMFFNTYSKLTRFMSFFSILGKHSYIIYLFHFFILQTLARYFSILSFPIFAGIMVLSILMPLVISVVYSEVAKLFYFPIKSFVSKIVAL